MQVQVTIPEWLKLVPQVRQKLIAIFEIPRSQGTSIEGNVIVSDGHTHKDLEAITVEKMRVFLDSEDTDFVSLFNKVVERIEEEKELLIPAEEMTRDQKLIEEWTLTIGKFHSQAVLYSLEAQFQNLIFKIVGPMDQKAELNVNQESNEKTQGLPAKKRGRSATKKTDEGRVVGDESPTGLGEASNLPDPAQTL